MKHLFESISHQTSKQVTHKYSTSFSLGIRMLNTKLHKPIYAIYGMVRLADEIVDTFHEYPQREMLDEFHRATFLAIDRGISLNPVLQSFQETVNRYNIDKELIEAFFRSMYMDLEPQEYDPEKYEEYILGSAQVVGLMCLKVFVNGDEAMYEQLRPGAMSLGSAFQKVNFLRDLNYDNQTLGRTYFPNLNHAVWTAEQKHEIEEDIEKDFRHALAAIDRLPTEAKFGVYTAYRYYYKLFKKIRRSTFKELLDERMRIPNIEKVKLILTSKARLTLGSTFL